MTSAISAPAATRPDYGVDAPDVIRNLFLAGATGLAVWGSAALGWWSGVIAIPVRRASGRALRSGRSRVRLHDRIHRDGDRDALLQQDRKYKRPRAAARSFRGGPAASLSSTSAAAVD